MTFRSSLHSGLLLRTARHQSHPLRLFESFGDKKTQRKEKGESNKKEKGERARKTEKGERKKKTKKIERRKK